MFCPDQYGSVGWGLSCKVKGRWFDSWSGHTPGLWAQSPVRLWARGNRSMLLSHIAVSNPVFLPPSPSL